MTDFTAEPASGRVFARTRLVRATDATADGRLRLDALARYLQDVAEDDVVDAGFADACDWLLRRSAVAMHGFPRCGETVELRTFCSATGPRWAERTTTLVGSDGSALIQTTAVWVAIARDTRRPLPLLGEFFTIYGEATEGRRVSSRLSHPGPPRGADGARPWPLRATDFDVAGHVNNAVHWAAAEDALAGSDWLPSHAEIEYHRPTLPGQEPHLLTHTDGDELDLWLVADSRTMASLRLTGK